MDIAYSGSMVMYAKDRDVPRLIATARAGLIARGSRSPVSMRTVLLKDCAKNIAKTVRSVNTPAGGIFWLTERQTGSKMQ